MLCFGCFIFLEFVRWARVTVLRSAHGAPSSKAVCHTAMINQTSHIHVFSLDDTLSTFPLQLVHNSSKSDIAVSTCSGSATTTKSGAPDPVIWSYNLASNARRLRTT